MPTPVDLGIRFVLTDESMQDFLNDRPEFRLDKGQINNVKLNRDGVEHAIRYAATIYDKYELPFTLTNDDKRIIEGGGVWPFEGNKTRDGIVVMIDLGWRKFPVPVSMVDDFLEQVKAESKRFLSRR